MKRALFSIAAAALLARAQPPPSSPVFHTDLSIVAVDAQVIEGDKAVAGLRQADFVVRENGRPQPVLYFGIDSEPLDLLLLLDMSGSMKPALEQLAAGAHEALAQLRPGDRVGLMVFDRKARLMAPLTADLRRIEARLRETVNAENIGGGTDINGAVFDAARCMRAQPKTNARRSILILTDNWSGKFKKNRTVIRELWEADAVLNALILKSTFSTVMKNYQRVANPWTMLLSADVKKIVRETGGESLNADSPAESLREMLERIRKRYGLHYRAAPGRAGEARSIRVELSPEAKKLFPNAKVRARRGYVLTEALP